MAVISRERKDIPWLKKSNREGIANWLAEEKPDKIGGFEIYTYQGYCKASDIYRLTDSTQELSSDLKKSIEESKELLKLGDDWDGEGGRGYLQNTLDKATKFLTDNALEYMKQTAIWIAAPEICPGPDGSIDLLWKLKDRELLINIPVEEGSLAGYYGDDSNGNTIKGKLNLTEQHKWILNWLMKRF